MLFGQKKSRSRRSTGVSLQGSNSKMSQSSKTEEAGQGVDLTRIIDTLKTHKGSVQLQSTVAKGSYNLNNAIINEIKDNFGELMCDQYANYFCQKLLQSSQPDQRITLLKALQKDFVSTACSEIGTHPMQRMLEMVSLEEERTIVYESIQPNIEQLSFHIKGNYVLISSLQVIPKQHLNQIIDEIVKFFDALVLD